MTSSPGDRPDELSGKLVGALDRIARGVRMHRQAVASAAGLTPLQADILRTVADGTPPAPQPSALAAELSISQPTASDALSTLVRKNLLRRSPTPGDGRGSTFALTSRGARFADELRQSDDALRQSVTELSRTDQEHALATLLELIANLLSSGLLQVARTCPTCRYFDNRSAPRCALLQTPLAAGDLRVNCPEHELSA